MSGGSGRGLLILAPLAIEARALRAGAPGAEVRRVGMGPRRASQSAAAIAEASPGPVLIAGFCGALDPRLSPGDVVLASELRGPDGTLRCPDPSILAGLLRRNGLTVHVGPLVSSSRLVVGHRRGQLQRTGALAVDMESVWLARGLDSHPLVALRVVVDTGRQELYRPLRTVAGALVAYRNLRRAAAVVDEWARVAARREVVLAAPRASCAGVLRAIETVRQTLADRGAPVYVRRQIVHNAHVVADLERQGARFVEELDEVPEGATVIFSAHGVSPAVREQAAGRALDVIDATCPLVSKVHAEARRFAASDFDIVLVGHDGHEEVEGTMGEAPERIVLIQSEEDVAALEVEDPTRVAYISQTTLSVDETRAIINRLRDKFPAIVGPRTDDICYATTNRQAAVKQLARACDLVLVIGSRNSSNSNRLVEVAREEGSESHLIDNEIQVREEWLTDKRVVGITSGASAPEELVQRLVEFFRARGTSDVHELEVVQEDVRFMLPKAIRQAMAASA